MKKVSLKGISEILSQKEMKNVMGGSQTSPGGNLPYFHRCNCPCGLQIGIECSSSNTDACCRAACGS